MWDMSLAYIVVGLELCGYFVNIGNCCQGYYEVDFFVVVVVICGKSLCNIK